MSLPGSLGAVSYGRRTKPPVPADPGFRVKQTERPDVLMKHNGLAYNAWLIKFERSQATCT